MDNYISIVEVIADLREIAWALEADDKVWFYGKAIEAIADCLDNNYN